MTTFTFLRTIPFVGNRPYVDIKIDPANPNSATYKCLVDTGADHLQLPAQAAHSVGINLTGSLVTVSTASGTTSMVLCSGIDIQIEGKLLHSRQVLFDMTNTAGFICGRTILLSAWDIGFDTTDWHHT